MGSGQPFPRPLAAIVVTVLAVAGCGGDPRRHVTLTATPADALTDHPVSVQITGLRVGQTATLSARWRDAAGTPWASRRTIRADGAGRVALTGIDGMRFIWSMRSQGRRVPYFDAPDTATAIRLQVDGPGIATAHATLVRRSRAPDVRPHVLRLRRESLDGIYYTPSPHRRRGPAVLTISGSDGGAPTDLAAQNASRGFPTLALYYFKRPGLPRKLDRVPLEYFARALRWLARRPGVDPARVVIDGGSRGGEAALLIAATYPRLVHGAIAIAPNYEVAGACCDPSVATDPAWTLHGRAVTPARIIPVERISGPVLVAGGGQDGVWSSSFYTHQIDDRLREHHFRYRHVRLDFPDAGHVFDGAEWPATDTTRFGGTPRANVAAGEALGRAVLRYLGARG